MFLIQRPDPIKDHRSVPDLHIITRAMNTQAFLFYLLSVQGYLNSFTLSYFLLFAIDFSFTFQFVLLLPSGFLFSLFLSQFHILGSVSSIVPIPSNRAEQ